jgi:hypothetical protein
MAFSNSATPIQILRSIVLGKRPDSARLLPGQPAVNTNIKDPGFYVADSTGNSLIKIGPCGVGNSAPNADATPPGQIGNSVGEMWLDTSGFAPILRVYTDGGWVTALPFVYAGAIVQDTTPSISNYPDNTMWWNSGTGSLYILYNDNNSRQWTQVTSSLSQ